MDSFENSFKMHKQTRQSINGDRYDIQIGFIFI
jgi:hypothetical protein